MTTLQEALENAGMTECLPMEQQKKQSKTIDELKSEDEKKHREEVMQLAEKFDFTAEDCIHFRKVVLDFYQGIERKRRLNVISKEDPASDVVGDVIMMIYIKLMYIGNAEMEKAKAEVTSDGKSVLKKDLKVWYRYYSNAWRELSRGVPVNDMVYLSGYAQMEDIVGDLIDGIMSKTYYPILNDLMKRPSNIESPILRSLAHGITAFTFMSLSVECGMKECHKSIAPVIDKIMKCMMVVISNIPSIHNHNIYMTEETLKQIEKTAQMVLINVTNKLCEAIYMYANSLDLTKYIESSDKTLEEVKDWLDKNKKVKIIRR